MAVVRNNQKSGRRWIPIALLCLGIAAFAAFIYFSFISGRPYFRRRNIRLMATQINGYGGLAPLAIFFLVLISTIIPPLPIPIPIIEIAAGYLFGFWEGFILIWFSEVISSFAAFEITRLLGRHIFRGILQNKYVTKYREYLKDTGAMGIIVTRGLFAAPMNIVSFLEGLTPMRGITFVGATALGTVPEAILYPFVGMLLKTTRFSLWRLFLIILVISAIGPVCTLLLFRTVRNKRRPKRSA